MRAMVDLTTSLSTGSISWKVNRMIPSCHRNQGLSKWPPPSTIPNRKRKRKIISLVRRPLRQIQHWWNTFSMMPVHYWAQTWEQRRCEILPSGFVLSILPPTAHRVPTNRKASFVWICPRSRITKRLLQLNICQGTKSKHIIYIFLLRGQISSPPGPAGIIVPAGGVIQLATARKLLHGWDGSGCAEPFCHTPSQATDWELGWVTNYKGYIDILILHILQHSRVNDPMT